MTCAKSPMCCEKSLVTREKSPMCCEKSLLWKEPYVLWKEPVVKRALCVVKRACCEKSLVTCKKRPPTTCQKSPVCFKKSPVYCKKSPIMQRAQDISDENFDSLLGAVIGAAIAMKVYHGECIHGKRPMDVWHRAPRMVKRALCDIKWVLCTVKRAHEIMERALCSSMDTRNVCSAP